jgi:hypothetical protein
MPQQAAPPQHKPTTIIRFFTQKEKSGSRLLPLGRCGALV